MRLEWATLQAGTLPQALPKPHAPPIGWLEVRQLGGIAFALASVSLGQTVPLLDDDVGAHCSARIFDECRQRPGAAEIPA